MGGGTASKVSSPSTSSSNAGVSKTVKAGLLIILCLQNAVYTMHRRYRCDRQSVRLDDWDRKVGRKSSGCTRHPIPTPVFCLWDAFYCC
ncbi:unnamed protein product, partial [Ectocarpus sp. 12 AP-2014]